MCIFPPYYLTKNMRPPRAKPSFSEPEPLPRTRIISRENHQHTRTNNIEGGDSGSAREHSTIQGKQRENPSNTIRFRNKTALLNCCISKKTIHTTPNSEQPTNPHPQLTENEHRIAEFYRDSFILFILKITSITQKKYAVPDPIYNIEFIEYQKPVYQVRNYERF